MRILGYLQPKGTRGSSIHWDLCGRYLGLSTAAAHRFVGTQSTINPQNFLWLHKCDSPSFCFKLHVLILNTWMVQLTFRGVGTAKSCCEDPPAIFIYKQVKWNISLKNLFKTVQMLKMMPNRHDIQKAQRVLSQSTWESQHLCFWITLYSHIIIVIGGEELSSKLFFPHPCPPFSTH